MAAKIKKDAPGGRLDFHCLRVSFISAVIESGATVKEAMAAARHSTPSLTLNTYGRARAQPGLQSFSTKYSMDVFLNSLVEKSTA